VGAFVLASAGHLSAAPAPSPRPPNVVIILADDMGWGDVGVFGNPTIRTPRLDRMAAEGQKWTSFYVGESVCTPSRAALLTGRLAIRYGLNPMDDQRRVFYPDSTGGLPASEITIAEILKGRGLRDDGDRQSGTSGHVPAVLPTAHGFDHYFGIPYSNDMEMIPIPGASFGGEDPKKRERMMNPRPSTGTCPSCATTRSRSGPRISPPSRAATRTKALRFIRDNASRPFFLYLAHTMPHMPLFASPEFAGKSRRGRYGDVIEELDWSVGQVLDTLRALGLDEQTLVGVLQRQRALVPVRRAGRIHGSPARGQGRDLRGWDARCPRSSAGPVTWCRRWWRTWARPWTCCRPCAR
jgi:arylsulfatase A-like enzyme